MNHIPEILLSNLFLLFIWGFFDVFLRNTKCFHANRFFLLAGSALAVVLPWLPWQVRIPVYSETILTYPENPAGGMMAFDPLPVGDIAAMSSATPINWPRVIYFSAVGILVLTFLAQSARMYLWTRRRPVSRWDRYRVVELNKQWPAFSFFSTIYYPEPFEPDKRETITILEHERVHARQLHSADNILLLAIRILFFYNPAVHFLAGRLRLTHEYLADAATAGTNKVEYSQTLIRHQFLVPRLMLMHSFNNQSFLKRRLNMLLKNNTSSRAGWLYLLAVPLLAGMFLLSGWSASAQNPETRHKDDMKDRISMEMDKTGFTKTSDSALTKDEVTVTQAAVKGGIARDIPQDGEKKVKACDEMPVFQGNRFTAFPDWVQSQLKFPEEAIKNGLTGGTVYVSFLVNKQGKMENVKIKKGVDPLLDEVVLKIVRSSPDWTPGKYKGKVVDVPFLIPIKFVLDGSAPAREQVTVENLGPAVAERKQVFLIVEEMPAFQGGTIDDFRKWVQANIVYPPEAKTRKITGTEWVSFVVDTMGMITDLQMVRSSDPLLAEEVIRVIKSAPAWNPGKQRGRLVNVSFSIPVKFVLDSSPAKEEEVTKVIIGNQDEGENQVFLVVEKMPKFKGGNIKKFVKWAQKNVKYPASAKESPITGTVEVSFVVNTAGQVEDVTVEKSLDPALDEAAISVVKSSPAWTPGKQRDKNVKVSFKIPIKFMP